MGGDGSGKAARCGSNSDPWKRQTGAAERSAAAGPGPGAVHGGPVRQTPGVAPRETADRGDHDVPPRVISVTDALPAGRWGARRDAESVIPSQLL